MAVSVIPVLLIVFGWLLGLAGLTVVGLSHLCKGPRCDELFVQARGASRWTRADELRAINLRRWGRPLMAVGVIALVVGYLLPT